MGNYRISVRRDELRDEFSVQIHDGARQTLAHVNAFSTLHAKKVARDLISLVRRGDPDGVFAVEKSKGRASA